MTTDFAPIFFKKSPLIDEIIEKELRESGKIPDKESQLAHSTDPPRIRCPLCQWQPRASDQWSCAPVAHPEYLPTGCGTTWNTFNTKGKCPGCSHQWRYTSCLRCAQWSRHGDWYQSE